MYKLKIYNARAQLLFCTLNLLFGDVLVAVVVVVCLSSLIRDLTQNTTATATRTSPNKRLMCKTTAVHVLYNSSYISLLSSAKKREMTKFCVVWRT